MKGKNTLVLTVAGVCMATAFFFIADAAGNTLPNGLQLLVFDIRTDNPPIAGSKVTVEMTLKNLGSAVIAFDNRTGIFVAARWNRPTNENSRDFGHSNKGLVLAPGKSVTVKTSRTLDAAGNWWFWPAFNIGGNWGPPRWMEKTLYVYGSNEEAAALPAKGLSVGHIFADRERYDEKNVTVIGRAMIVRKKKDGRGRPSMLISFFDMKNDRQVINVFGPGHPAVGNGDVVRVTGVYKVKSKRGRYTFNDEIQTTSDRVVVVTKSKY